MLMNVVMNDDDDDGHGHDDEDGDGHDDGDGIGVHDDEDGGGEQCGSECVSPESAADGRIFYSQRSFRTVTITSSLQLVVTVTITFHTVTIPSSLHCQYHLQLVGTVTITSSHYHPTGSQCQNHLPKFQ